MTTTVYSPIHQVLALLHDALNRLGKTVDWAAIEPIGTTIFLAMEGSRRKFHTTKHLLEVCAHMNPTQTLAGLFHDVVYVQIDGGFPPQTDTLLAPYVVLNPQNLTVNIRHTVIENPLFEVVLQVFGFVHGQTLSPFTGQNEFLSALLSAILLHPYLSITELLAVLAGIEATIPFRKKSHDNQPTCSEALQQRLEEIAKMLQLSLSLQDIKTMVTKAVELGNRDVANFGHEDIGYFLDNTWTLLPETNYFMWQSGVYSVVGYRNALLKMETFLGLLNPQDIFHQYNGTPPTPLWEAWVQNATRNVQLATQYIGMKLLPIAVIETLAKLTGGDAPLSMFVGDVPTNQFSSVRAEDFLPPNSSIPLDLQTDTIYQLLAIGRTSPISFDLQNSPLAAYMYVALSPAQRQTLLQGAKLFFQEQLTPIQFLQKVPTNLLNTLIAVIAQVAISRTTVLEKIATVITGANTLE